MIFVDGKYNNKLMAHPGGVLKFITLHLDLEKPLAMKENHHSLKHSGMEKIIHLIESNYSLAQSKDLDVIRYLGEGRVNDRCVWIIEGTFPKDLGFYAHKIKIFIGKSAKLPLRISIYGWSKELREEYVFQDLKIKKILSD